MAVERNITYEEMMQTLYDNYKEVCYYCPHFTYHYKAYESEKNGKCILKGIAVDDVEKPCEYFDGDREYFKPNEKINQNIPRETPFNKCAVCGKYLGCICHYSTDENGKTLNLLCDECYKQSMV